MNKKIFRLIVSLVWFGLLCGWAAPALALYPPAQNLLYASVNNNVVNYTVQDPMTTLTVSDSWTLDLGFPGVWGIDPPVADGGIVAWVSRRMLTGETEYTFTLHYRIYDPGRGRWVGGDHAFGIGTGRVISAPIVKDGVVAWKRGYRGGASPTADKTFLVTCVTYNPVGGFWPEDTYTLTVPYDSPRAVENLRVHDGVVAWPTLPFDGGMWNIHMRIYDPEINLWVGHVDSTIPPYQCDNCPEFDWLEIENATVHVRMHWLHDDDDKYFGYDTSSHQWDPFPYTLTNPWASFVAQPASGSVPLWVCFWDRSIGVNGANWLWNFADGGNSDLRSPMHTFATPWNYPVTLTLPNYQGYNRVYQQTVQVNAPTFTGNISIKNGATYSNSTHVSVYLQFSSPNGAQMRFRNYAYPQVGPEWYPWVSYAPTSEWILSPSDEGKWFATIQFKDNNGFLSPEYTDSIILDFTRPAATLTLNDGATTTLNPQATMKFSATDANEVAWVSYTAFNQEDSYYIWSLWEPYQGAPVTKSLTFSSKPGLKTVIMHFMDAAGNITEKGHHHLET
jgi:PKD repeat protein